MISSSAIKHQGIQRSGLIAVLPSLYDRRCVTEGYTTKDTERKLNLPATKERQNISHGPQHKAFW
jgi:hypothetical protein